MITRGRVGYNNNMKTQTKWGNSQIRAMVQGFSRIDCTSMESEEGVKWLFTQIIPWMIIIYVGLIVYMLHITLLNLALIPTKPCHVPLLKIRNTGMWRWPADTYEEWSFFHGNLKWSIMSRIAHIYAYTTKHKDKSTYMNYWNINNIIHHIWIKQVKKRNWIHQRTTEREYILLSTLYISAFWARYWKK